MDALLFAGFGILLMILGAIFIFCSDWIWKIDTFFDVKGGEPTDWYTAKVQLVGIVLFLAGFFALGYAIVTTFHILM